MVYAGIKQVDKTNRVLITFKFLTLTVVVLLLMPNISFDKLITGQLSQLSSVTAITVTCTSFGWAILIPSLRTYFSDDIKRLRKAIIIGSLLPLICYIVWDAVIMGILPLSGDNSLQTILNAPDSTTRLIEVLSALEKKPAAVLFINAFISISVLTSFLGVALCLTDFLADGLKLEKKGGKNVLLHLLTFIPAVIIATYVPGLFIKSLKCAGLYCLILLIFMPAWMAWCGRYRCNYRTNYTFPGGKCLLGLILFVSFWMITYVLIDIAR